MIAPDIETLIIGDSHSECSFNPEEIKNSINVAQSAECYFYTFYKLKYLLEKHSQIKYIVLSYSYNNLNSFWDDFVHQKEKAASMLDRYFQILEPGAFFSLLSYGFGWKYFLGHLGFPLKQNIVYISRVMNRDKNGTILFMGKYNPFIKVNLNDTIIYNGIQNTFYINGKVRQVSELQTEYLIRIAHLCQSKNIHLLLVNTPVYAKYLEKIPEQFIKHYDHTTDHLEGMKLISVLNYVTFPIPDYGYYDPTHLNVSGAKLFSKEISQRISSIKSISSNLH